MGPFNKKTITHFHRKCKPPRFFVGRLRRPLLWDVQRVPLALLARSPGPPEKRSDNDCNGRSTPIRMTTKTGRRKNMVEERASDVPSHPSLTLLWLETTMSQELLS